MLIAIDFDDVIHDPKNRKAGYRLGPPMPGAQEALRTLQEQGHKILIHSCKPPAAIRGWMDYFKMPYDYIWGEDGATGSKPNADWFVDNKALEFNGSWQEILDRISGKVSPMKLA